MYQLNSIILEGSAVKDVEVVEPMSGFSVGKFTIGVSRWFKNKENVMTEEVSYFDCECYGVIAETFAKKIIKGRELRLVGRLKQERWTDSEQKEHSRVYVVCEHIEMKPTKEEQNKQDEEEQPLF